MSNLILSEFLFKIDKPILFKNILKFENGINSAINWTPDYLANILNNKKFEFRIGRKNTYTLQFENECNYVEASIGEFLTWFREDNISEENPFSNYDKKEHWAYADYKHMVEFLDENMKSCIDWKSFGFQERNANDSTFWLGTASAYTPCHYDTYGYNLVAQIFGKKRWIMFPKSDTQFMSATRIPFEESTVYSQVNIKCPDLNKFKLFKNVHPHVIDLEPGDLLYVPHNWWHYVECLDLAISINTWVEIPSDDTDRLKEILTKTLLQSLMESNFVPFETWLNESEEFTTQEDNMRMIHNCLKNAKNVGKNIQSGDNYELNIENHKNFSKYIQGISFENFLSVYVENENDNMSINETSETDENLDLILKLSKAISNPLVISLVNRLLLEDT